MKRAILNLFPPFLREHAEGVDVSSIGYRFARGAFWSVTGAVISRGMALISSFVVARYIGKYGFGELGIIQSTAGMFQVFAGFGLALTGTKHVAELREKDPQKAGRIIALSNLVAAGTGVVFAAVLFFLAPWIAAKILAAERLTGLLRVSSLLLFFGALNGAQTGALSGFEAFKTIARVNMFAGVSSFPLMVGGVYLAGLEGVVWGLVASMVVNLFLNHIALRKESQQFGVPLTYAGCVREWPVLLSFSVPAVLSGAMVTPVYWACSAMLVNQPDGYSEMGIYNAANQWFGALLFIPVMVGQVVLPMLSERVGMKDEVRSTKILSFSIKFNALLVSPLILLACLASPWIMNGYGEEFRNGWITLVVVLVTAGLLAVQTPVGHIIAASGKMWVAFLMNSGWALSFIVFTILFVKWGSLGLASARLFAYCLHAIWTFAWVYSITRGKIAFHDV